MGVSSFWTVLRDSPSCFAELGRSGAERFQNIFFAIGSELFLGDGIARLTIHSADTDDVRLPMLEIEPVKIGFASEHAGRDRPRSLETVCCPAGLPISRKVPAGCAGRRQAQERRLLKLSGETLSKGLVKDGVAGLVGEIRENDGVGLGQGVRAARVVEPARQWPRRRPKRAPPMRPLSIRTPR